MKKYLNRLMSAVFVAVTLSSCSLKLEVFLPKEYTPITVTADVQQHTKAGYESGVTMPECFVIDIVQGGKGRYDYSMIKMTKETGSSIYATPAGINMYWDDDTFNADVKAMTVPLGLSEIDADNVMEINVSLEQNVEENVAVSDLLGATSEADGGISISASGNINIEFKHLLSKLDVNYEFSEEFGNDNAVINTIVLKNVCTSGGYSYAAMNHVTTDLKYGDIVMYNNTAESMAEAIFYPYNPTSTPSLLINSTINGVEYNFTCPVVPKGSNGFVAGKRYTMTVSIIGSSVSGTDASIANGWDTDTDEESFTTEK